MNATMKLSVLAGALALAVAGQANAASTDTIVNGGTFANNLVLSVWDTTANTSYTGNLGVTMQSFLNGITFGGTAKVPAISGASTQGNFSFSDATLTSFLAKTTDAYVWSVAAVSVPGIFYGTSGILSTTNSGRAAVANTTAPNFTAAATVMNGTYLADVNTMLTAAPAGTISITTPAGYAGAAYMGNSVANGFAGAVPFTNTAALGTSQSFFFVTPTQNSRSQYAGSTNLQFLNSTGAAATWTLGTNGALSYAVAAAVAPVPEPGEWLLMLSGLALIGFIATRRKNENGMTFA